MTLPSNSQPATRRWPLLLAFGGAQALVLVLLLGPLWGLPWWRGFRGFYAFDQLSYAAIAANVAEGRFDLVEPFTETGSLYYPSLWYFVIGFASRLTGLPVYLLWTSLALAIVCAAIGVVGWVAYRVSGRAWAPLLPSLALFTGTLSVAASGFWRTSIGNHAVLWGPYGTLFTLNAETVGLCLIAIAMSLLLLAVRRPPTHSRSRAALIVSAAALIGVLANVQTYSFFSGLTLVGLFVASVSLLHERSRPRTLITLALVGLLLVSGTAIASATGPLPLVGLLLASLLPAVWPLLRRHWGLAWVAGTTTAVVAAPQVIRTLVGLAANDPFLTYRQSSTEGLGVPLGPGLLAAMPLLLVALVCAVALWRRGPIDLSAMLIALGAGAILMSSNDLWGFAQEPYRFWLQYAVLSSLLITPVLAWTVTQAPRLVGGRRTVFAAVASVAAAVWLVGLADVPSFWLDARQQGVIPAEDSRAMAIRTLLGSHEDLVLSSACITAQELKLVSPGPVAFYNEGLAWPADEPALAQLQDEDAPRAAEDVSILQAADVRLVLTDSACVDDWRYPDNPHVQPLRSVDYEADGQPQTLTLWSVASP